jgi:integrase
LAEKQMRAINKLSAAKIAKLSKPGMYSDGDGLYLRVAPGGSKQWMFRYALGRERQMGLGSLRDVSLAEARVLAREARRVLREGRDPLEDRRQKALEARTAKAKAMTFGQAVDGYHTAHQSKWTNPKHRAQVRSTLTTHAASLHPLPLTAIDTHHVLAALKPIWSKTPETARRTRGRIEAVLAWGIAQGLRPEPNPARWKGHLDQLLPSRAGVGPVKHHRAMPYDQIPAFAARLAGQQWASHTALRFLILTAARTGEVRGARWQEFDLQARLWSVPAERMKARRVHRVPLSEPALELINGLQPFAGTDLVFPGARDGQPLSDMALLEVMRGLQLDYVPHGFRASFKSWATDKTAHAREAIEMALAHRVGDAVERAYMRTDMLEKRHELMRDWGNFISGKSAPL